MNRITVFLFLFCLGSGLQPEGAFAGTNRLVQLLLGPTRSLLCKSKTAQTIVELAPECKKHQVCLLQQKSPHRGSIEFDSRQKCHNAFESCSQQLLSERVKPLIQCEEQVDLRSQELGFKEAFYQEMGDDFFTQSRTIDQNLLMKLVQDPFVSSDSDPQHTQTVEPEKKQAVSEMAKKAGLQYLRHGTSCDQLREILMSGKLLAGTVTGRMNYSRTLKQVFLELMRSSDPRPTDQVVLYFDLSLLDRRTDYHVTTAWMYGRFVENHGIGGPRSAHPENSALMRDVLNVISRSREPTEVVFYNEVNLEHLVEIRIPKGREDLKMLIPTQIQVVEYSSEESYEEGENLTVLGKWPYRLD